MAGGRATHKHAPRGKSRNYFATGNAVSRSGTSAAEVGQMIGRYTQTALAELEGTWE
jgi:hypothetical protein